MSKKSKKIPVVPKAILVEVLEKQEGDSVLMDEPRHVINEIIVNTNAFVSQNQPDLTAMLYLGSAQRYALRFINTPGLIDPMQGTFAGIPVIWVDQSYHVNLVARRDAPEQG